MELCDHEAEEAVVCILWDESSCFGAGEALKRLEASGLDESDFTRLDCRRAFNAIREASKRGHTVTGEIPGLEQNSHRLVSAEQIGTYASRLRELTGRRALQSAYREGLRLVGETELSLAELLSRSEALLRNVPIRGTHWGSDGNARVRAHLDIVRDGNIPPSVRTGFSKIDDETGGLPPTLVVVAAMPGVGKSAFLGSVVRNMASRGEKSAVFCMEDPSEWLSFRYLAHLTGLPQFVLRYKPLTDSQFGRVAEHWNRLDGITKHVMCDDREGLTAPEVLFSARDAIHNHGAKAIFLDNMTAMRFHRGPRMDLEIQDFLVAARALAGEAKVPFVVLSHVKRRDDLDIGDMPRLTDCTETSAFEKLARLAYGLSRDKETNEIRVGVLKNTNGRSHVSFVLNLRPNSALVEEERQVGLPL